MPIGITFFSFHLYSTVVSIKLIKCDVESFFLYLEIVLFVSMDRKMKKMWFFMFKSINTILIERVILAN